MNFAATLAFNQKFGLLNDALPWAGTPESLLAYMRDRLAPAGYDTQVSNDLLNYLYAGAAWTGEVADGLGAAQVRIKAAGLAHLIGGSSEYQLM